MRGIDKAFPGVRALDNVSFDCRAGEVHVICGENGAGKSTLIKVLGGIYAPDAGTVLIDWRPVRFGHPLEAREAGIGIIHQELSLLPDRTVAENLFLGREPARYGLLDRAAMCRGARELLARLASPIDPDLPCGRLTIHEMQAVEIAKALGLAARILVLDEPTAALDAVESERLLALLRRLRIERTYLCGVQTPNCIRGTALDANASDYECVVLSDATASATAAVQQANLFDMRNMGIEILTTAAALAEVQRPSEAGPGTAASCSRSR